ncbi:hypothetical protein FKP32DRAFT_1552462, partial [Trametes sanguinea]
PAIHHVAAASISSRPALSPTPPTHPNRQSAIIEVPVVKVEAYTTFMPFAAQVTGWMRQKNRSQLKLDGIPINCQECRPPSVPPAEPIARLLEMFSD